MPYLLGALFVWQITLDIFVIDKGLAPGISFKNLFLYSFFAFLMLRGMLTRELRFRPRGMHTPQLLLILYALLTWVVASFIIRYDNYDVVGNGLLIKPIIADFYVMFLVCFFAVRTKEETDLAMRLAALASNLPQLFTLAEVSGLTGFGVSPIRDDGRVDGALGEANMYAAYIAFFLPIYIARAVTDRGFWRTTWIASAGMAAVVMLLTVSRGGFLGLFVGAIIAAYIFRRQLPVSRLLAIGTAGIVLCLLVMFAINSEFRSLVLDRLMSESGQADLGEATSGRTDFWIAAIKVMAAEPLTFLTGYGWRVYWSMPFQYSPHNTYLSYWFNLGLPGLICLIIPFVTAIKLATKTAKRLTSPDRFTYIAFVVSLLSVATAVFFIEMFAAWLYIWAYIGFVTRAGLLAVQTEVQNGGRPVLQQAPVQASDRYGWHAQPQSTNSPLRDRHG